MDQRKKIPQALIYCAMANSKFSIKTAKNNLMKSIFPHRPSVEEIRSWAKSFDKLMRSSGDDGSRFESRCRITFRISLIGGRKIFRDFLRCEYSEENILFWLACEELKQETNPEAIEEKARYIYEDYISILSPKEVNFRLLYRDQLFLTNRLFLSKVSLDSRVREIVNRNMVEPTPNTFDEAQLQIYTLMHRDSYPR